MRGLEGWGSIVARRFPFGKDEVSSIEKQNFTIFVENLSVSMSKGWLHQLFAWTRHIADIYISRKQRKESVIPFVFIRYETKGAANKAVAKFDAMEIRGHKLCVNNVKYKRGEKEQKGPMSFCAKVVKQWR